MERASSHPHQGACKRFSCAVYQSCATLLGLCRWTAGSVPQPLPGLSCSDCAAVIVSLKVSLHGVPLNDLPCLYLGCCCPAPCVTAIL